MNSKRTFFVLVALLCVLIGISVAGTFYGTKMLKKSGESLLDKKTERAALEKDEASLAQAKRDIEQYNDLQKIAKSIVPQEKDQARTVREIVSLAAKSDIKIESISFPASTLGQKPKSTSKSTGGAQKQTQTSPSQLIPVEGLSGVFAMPIQVMVSKANQVRYDQMLRFLQSLEQNRRTSHITNLSITPSEEDRNLISFTLQINAYIKP